MSGYNLRFALRNLFGRYPALFFLIYGIRPRNRRLSVRRKTELVIEGFPRSANTYTVVALKLAQQREIKIASHLHVPAQVIKAAKLRIPTLVLIRNPKDAVTSLLVRNPQIGSRQALRAYSMFYNALSPYIHECVLATFEAAIQHLDRVIEDVNACFGTELSLPKMTDRVIQKVYKQIDEENWRASRGKNTHLARPSPLRDDEKHFAMSRVESIKNRKALSDAETTYKKTLEIYMK